ncbi:MAG TPA: plastocyanin/azurin family copper-binding protein [Solirubrobacteraceae bacterium]|jgi:plastocyanin|nr:plastocyanin/azurin family copper-binding protein [Solirubrobacteraceae bacterium]
MFATALHLVPILGAEKSKVPFYVVGGVLICWALVISLGVGLRQVEFPRTEGAERIVIAVSVLLVLATLVSAVATSSRPAKSAAATLPAGGGGGTAPVAATPSGAPPPGPAGSAPSSTRLALAADPSGALSYTAKRLDTKAGRVGIVLTNASPVPHNLTVATAGGTVLGATPTFQGGSQTLTLGLRPGKYVFYCSVPGHRQAGMEGTLTIS